MGRINAVLLLYDCRLNAVFEKKLNFLHSQVARTHKKSLAPEPHSETFTNYFCFLVRDQYLLYLGIYFSNC